MNTIYKHLDGHSLDFTTNSLTMVSSDGIAVSIPIGQHGLRELGERLIAESTRFTEEDCAEQAGHLLAANVLNDFLECETQAEKSVILLEALQYLAKLEHHDRACAGFSVALVNVIEIGLQNLPEGEAQ